MQQPGRAAEIKANGIGKSFGSFRALDNLTLDIGRGEFLTLLGPSGSGKTTFLMILAGFVQPTEGRLFSDGTDITDRPAEQRAAGMVFQGYALFPHMSVEQNIAFPLKVRKKSAAEIKKRVGEMIERVGLVGHEKKLPAQLSGGQQQRVALARALVFEPGVLLLDEPFSALDKSLRGQMQAEMKRLHQETGTTFVFVTHDQSEALALSSRVAIFNHGKLLQVGAPDEVYDRPANRFVAEFLGEINMLPLKGVRRADNGATGLCEDRAVSLRGNPGSVGGNAILAIRPEYMSIAGEASAGENGVAATATNSTYLGAATRLDLTTRQGAKVTVSVPNEVAAAALSKGNSVWLTWPAEKGFLLPDGGQ
ncbi:ABC transporter ATP-binding protein [Mesorhizobium sp. B2-3-3]|uniref:ABC transporter ATP-binding protein n=1 Tax=unclassified Mesorhizobium TaxID=325217 RepID=UPI00112B2FD8|nr:MULTISPECIES: ABC transporter ATP-binding protein [unclassified Mesorhizobium]TPN41087.1 ABC transporter ATP-binding protein [Mesorhizobium sp. B2-3-3]TPK76439.1 ABC transporter ATP-binding protein [Mesorhizobium sp. B2-4-15]TPK92040.1 ABC transporter ATP-binding protein [Mesorhizobium sp. B2-4-17]TPL07554.1 ABC transporter ATP-binding protein [Mesorhizobium sp. B2-4-14]TPM32570.1 ABC transporter ATP-binding protein [Mesorhizobium sp. B2-3-5]